MSDMHSEFLRTYAEYPSQDNEGHVPDRGGFKAGFGVAWELKQAELEQVKQERDEALAELGKHYDVPLLEVRTAERDQVIKERDEARKDAKLWREAEASRAKERDGLKKQADWFTEMVTNLEGKCDAAIKERDEATQKYIKYSGDIARIEARRDSYRAQRDSARAEAERLKEQVNHYIDAEDAWAKSDDAAQAEVARLREALEKVRDKVRMGVTYQTQEDLIAGLEHIRNEVSEIARAALAEGEGKEHA